MDVNINQKILKNRWLTTGLRKKKFSKRFLNIGQLKILKIQGPLKLIPKYNPK